MSLVVLEDANLSFGGKKILQGVNLHIGEGDRIGLIGLNGSGKSTLLRVIVGQQGLDGGIARSSKNCRIGYLPQDVLELAGESLLNSVLQTVPGRGDIEQRIEETQVSLSETQEPERQLVLATTLADLHERLEHFEVYFSARRAQSILVGLGFKEKDFSRATSELSGGWKMRAALAGLLFQRPDVFLLDEPTNHLDVPSVRWLNGFLAESKAAMLLICHDREFLNKHVDRIFSFEPEGLRVYRGDYDSYLEQREGEKEIIEARARNRDREIKELERFVERFRAKATKARQAQSRAKQIKRLQKD
ncbi:MAG: ATP-binding cassette domain-containing protein, partial [Pseudomonadota bacterium]